MKKQMMALLVSAVAATGMAQETNNLSKRPVDEHAMQAKTRDRDERKEMTPEEIEKREQRTVQLMDRVLTEIGVSDEDKEKIRILQKAHHENMKSNMEQSRIAREKLSRLQKEGATEAELDAAIDEITAAQGDQLRILVRNRLEMEQILGKEKYGKFMDSARMQFRKSGGRRSGEGGVPPRPELLPLPNPDGPGGGEAMDPPVPRK